MTAKKPTGQITDRISFLAMLAPSTEWPDGEETGTMIVRSNMQVNEMKRVLEGALDHIETHEPGEPPKGH